jgi:pre-mRNA-processing factor 8
MFYFNPLIRAIPLLLYHTMEIGDTRTCNLNLSAFYFNPLIPLLDEKLREDDITSDAIALWWAPEPYCRRSGQTHRAQDTPLVKNWYLER